MLAYCGSSYVEILVNGDVMDWTMGEISRLLKENSDTPQMGKFLGELYLIESETPGWWRDKYRNLVTKYVSLSGDSDED